MKNSERTETRKNEILDIAERLFTEKGYENTTINDILTVSGAAKGSLYYHYKSKEDVLDGIVSRVTKKIIEAARVVADDPHLTANEKMRRIIPSVNVSDSPDGSVIEELHRPSNALMHQKSIAQTIIAVAPIITEVVRQGIKEGVYETRFPLETVEILLIAGQFLFDGGIFKRTPEETASRMAAYVQVAETALGAKPGSFNFLAGGKIDE